MERSGWGRGNDGEKGVGKREWRGDGEEREGGGEEGMKGVGKRE